MTSPENNRPDQAFEQRARELWREAGQHVDPATAGRLRAARRHALASTKPQPHGHARWLVPGGALAAIALAVFMVRQPLPTTHVTNAPPAVRTLDAGSDIDTDLPPDADKTDPTLYQDMDFYGWLAATDTKTANR